MNTIRAAAAAPGVQDPCAHRRLPRRARLTVLLLCAGAVWAAGCAAPQPSFNPNGMVFYCDGAGGGGVTNWGAGVKKGLDSAGYAGGWDEYDWETGLGVVADQVESVAAKRAQGSKVAKQIIAYQARYPDAPVHLIGLSAGTAIAIYALEALPDDDDNRVDTVVMLSSSVASNHDLTEALKRVAGDMYVTTSPNDVVLGQLAPAFGTADRQFVGQQIAGLHGFMLPPGAGPETRRLYSKVVILAWDPSLDRYGDYGGHTDTAKPEFVQHVVAPLILGEGPRYVRVHSSGSAGRYMPASR